MAAAFIFIFGSSYYLRDQQYLPKKGPSPLDLE
jgi:hypothetical protein